MVALPLAAFATQLFKAGVGDAAVDLDRATAVFDPVVKRLANFNRDAAPRFVYSRIHTT